jgi:hypothetical protein
MLFVRIAALMFLGYFVCFSYVLQESILDYNNDVQLSFISKAFLGAASASKGKRLELSDRVTLVTSVCFSYLSIVCNIFHIYFLVCNFYMFFIYFCFVCAALFPDMP